jgi:NAD(P)-dependent dehydrogenase (short-subunit alcohol dehydrogenase family)
MKLPDRARVFVTGGGSGLGRALAVRFARDRHARVFVTDVDRARAEATAALVEAAGGSGKADVLDVRDAQAFADAAHACDGAFGGVDVVVNNAGVAVGGAIGEASLADWRFIVDINLWGVIHGCHTFAPKLKAQRSGFVLNVASAAGIATLPEMGAYNTTKAAVIALSETLYGELRPAGVHVSVLCPTFFPTNLMESFRSPTDSARKKAEAFFRKAKFTADDVAGAALAGLEKRQLHILPMPDARVVWRLKRLSPQSWLDGTVKMQQRYERWLGR